MRSNALTAVDVASATVKWTFSGDAALCTSASIAGKGAQVFVGSTLGNVYELDEATGVQKSSDSAGALPLDGGKGGVSCSSDIQSMTVAQNHLLVPAGNTLVVY